MVRAGAKGAERVKMLWQIVEFDKICTTNWPNTRPETGRQGGTSKDVGLVDGGKDK